VSSGFPNAANEPVAVRGTEDGELGLAVAVVVGGDRLVTRIPQVLDEDALDVPIGRRRPEDGDVVDAIAGEIGARSCGRGPDCDERGECDRGERDRACVEG
jgi:hypothetical protein